jgi:hypothetical protein
LAPTGILNTDKSNLVFSFIHTNNPLDLALLDDHFRSFQLNVTELVTFSTSPSSVPVYLNLNLITIL